MAIHPTAVIDPKAELGDVEVGPYAVIEAGAVLHDGVSIGAHAVIQGATTIGARTVVHPHAVVGGAPQDLKHDLGIATELQIGEDNVIREFASLHRGTSGGRGITTVGDRNYFMAQSHVAHDCVVGDDCMFANSAAIGGHVVVGDRVVLGGLSAVHQNTRIGRLAMVGGGAMCAQDVPPFTLAQGDRARLFGLNIIGIRRAGLDSEIVASLKTAWRLLFNSDLPLRAALPRVRAELADTGEIAELLTFIESSQRGLCRPVGAGGRG